jgi:hypothetical protein
MRVDSPPHAHAATHGELEGHTHTRSATQASGAFNGPPVSMARAAVPRGARPGRLSSGWHSG